MAQQDQYSAGFEPPSYWFKPKKGTEFTKGFEPPDMTEWLSRFFGGAAPGQQERFGAGFGPQAEQRPPAPLGKPAAATQAAPTVPSSAEISPLVRQQFQALGGQGHMPVVTPAAQTDPYQAFKDQALAGAGAGLEAVSGQRGLTRRAAAAVKPPGAGPTPTGAGAAYTYGRNPLEDQLMGLLNAGGMPHSDVLTPAERAQFQSGIANALVNLRTGTAGIPAHEMQAQTQRMLAELQAQQAPGAAETERLGALAKLAATPELGPQLQAQAGRALRPYLGAPEALGPLNAPDVLERQGFGNLAAILKSPDLTPLEKLQLAESVPGSETPGHPVHEGIRAHFGGQLALPRTREALLQTAPEDEYKNALDRTLNALFGGQAPGKSRRQQLAEGLGRYRLTLGE